MGFIVAFSDYGPSDRALSLAADDFEGHVAVPVDEFVHRLQSKIDGHREILDKSLELTGADPLCELGEGLIVVASRLVVADPTGDRLRHPPGRRGEHLPRAVTHPPHTLPAPPPA